MNKYGDIAYCGKSKQDVVVSSYNINCPCLNCAGCDKQQCQFLYVLQTDPRADNELFNALCVNCIPNPKERIKE